MAKLSLSCLPNFTRKPPHVLVRRIALALFLSFISLSFFSGARAQIASDFVPAPDAGKQWTVTFDDEFNGAAIDTSKWNGEFGGGLQWCGNGTCEQNYVGLVESGGVLQIYPGGSAANGTGGINTGGPTAATAKFSQRYGYFSVRAKLPTFSDIDGAPLWVLPIRKSSFPSKPDCTVDGNEEIDLGEGYNLVPGSNPTQLSFSIHDFCFNTPSIFFPQPPTDTSADFHVYGFQWRDNGSLHGTFQPFFDGVPQAAPFQTDDRANLWDNGVYLLASEASKTVAAPPLIIDWIHVYQQTAASGWPTPPPTPVGRPSFQRSRN